MPEYWSQRVSVITGGYGSGKTEVAINIALKKRAFYQEDIYLVDLDIVNPYFRSRDILDQLLEQGVKVIAPEGALRTADLPALPAEIGGVLQNKECHVVLDVGGDPAGAKALGRYSYSLTEAGYDMIMVVNPNRPHTSNVESIVELITRIETASRLKISNLCNNGNVMQYTTVADIEAAHALLLKVAEITQIPLSMTSCPKELAHEVAQLLATPVLPLSLSMRPPW